MQNTQDIEEITDINLTPINNNSELIDNTATIILRKCRRCGNNFVPYELAPTNARYYRCKNCLGCISLAEDIVHSCILS